MTKKERKGYEGQRKGAWRERRGNVLTSGRVRWRRSSLFKTRRSSRAHQPVEVGEGRRKAVMEWWQRVVLPLKRALIAVAARLSPRKDGGGILKLHNDVESCGYRDVEVMWEILQRSEPEVSHSPKRKQPIGRVSVWSGRA